MNKLFVRKKKKQPEKPERVTEDSIEEHREKVLSKGRKFKYPIQYARYKLVINTVLVGVVAVLLLGVFGWLQLYQFQSTGDLAYRVVKILPLPVAEVDGRAVRYSDYLMIFRSSLAAVERQQGKLEDTEDDKVLREHFKRVALDDAEVYTYAMKLAEELGIEVTQEQIDQTSYAHRMVDGVEKSEENFVKILEENFGLSKSEYERLVKMSLIKMEVSLRIDEEAKKLADEIEMELASEDINTIAEKYVGKVSYEDTGGLVDNMNLDGGRAEVAAELEVGQVSGRLVSKNGDGYYFVKLIAKEDDQVRYVSILISFTELDNRMAALRENGGIKEHIRLNRE